MASLRSVSLALMSHFARVTFALEPYPSAEVSICSSRLCNSKVAHFKSFEESLLSLPDPSLAEEILYPQIVASPFAINKVVRRLMRVFILTYILRVINADFKKGSLFRAHLQPEFIAVSRKYCANGMKSVRSCINDGRGLHVFSLSSYGLQPRACSSSNTSLSVSLGLSAALSDMNMAGVTKSLRFPRPKLADLRKLALYGYFYRKSFTMEGLYEGTKGYG